MSEAFQFVIPLFPVGDDGSAFRLRNIPGGEMQRPHVIQYGSELAVHADIFNVKHGTFTPGGDPATLVVFDFRFVGSESHGRRFRKAIIDVRFAPWDRPVGSENDPEVSSIAPLGFCAWNPSTEEKETKLSFTVSANTGGLVGMGIGSSWETTKKMTKEKRTTLFGSMRIEGKRDYGTQNTAKWLINENEIESHGIPSHLRTAILVKLKGKEKFQAIIEINAEVDILYGAKKRIDELFGKHVVDPVYFDAEDKRKPFGPEITNIDTTNLSMCDLRAIGSQLPTTC
ncbi:hypothetical protein BDD12DRAFT_813776 [Trichophaea hybrida]|nr:hypothetical protein BDD12DRAFT_813776 [Trichophaea hybrida]